MDDLIELQLPEGQTIWARVETRMGPRDVGVLPGKMTVDNFRETLEGVANTVRSGLRSARPQQTTVEFGVELAFGKTGVVAALAGTSAKAAIKVSLSWGETNPSVMQPDPNEEAPPDCDDLH